MTKSEGWRGGTGSLWLRSPELGPGLTQPQWPQRAGGVRTTMLQPPGMGRGRNGGSREVENEVILGTEERKLEMKE